jgi:hypothetical protein
MGISFVNAAGDGWDDCRRRAATMARFWAGGALELRAASATMALARHRTADSRRTPHASSCPIDGKAIGS